MRHELSTRNWRNTALGEHSDRPGCSLTSVRITRAKLCPLWVVVGRLGTSSETVVRAKKEGRTFPARKTADTGKEEADRR